MSTNRVSESPAGPATGRSGEPGRADRHPRLDALRGIAILWMTAFHFAFDLSHFAGWRQDFYNDPFWTLQRAAIVSLFLFCAGMGQAIATRQAQPWPRFWRRWGQVAGCALLVTLGSALVFPRSFIYFGVLHAIAVMWVVARLTAGWGRWLWLAGALAIGLKFAAAWAHGAGLLPDLLHAPALNWLGFIGRRPVTEDHVPLVPWLAAVWWGLACGQWALRRRPTWLAGGLPKAAGPLAALGRWSLTWYMLHQPVLIAGLLAALWLFP